VAVDDIGRAARVNGEVSGEIRPMGNPNKLRWLEEVAELRR
jgi:hypothetical protein